MCDCDKFFSLLTRYVFEVYDDGIFLLLCFMVKIFCCVFHFVDYNWVVSFILIVKVCLTGGLCNVISYCRFFLKGSLGHLLLVVRMSVCLSVRFVVLQCWHTMDLQYFVNFLFC